MGPDLLIAAEVLLRGARRARNPQMVALWSGFRLGILDAEDGPELFAGLLEDQDTDLLRVARGGYICGRAGLSTTDVLDQLDRERHEAVVRMTGFGLIPARPAGTGQMCPSGTTRP